jgi:hypothetical protein
MTVNGILFKICSLFQKENNISLIDTQINLLDFRQHNNF